MDKQKLAPFKAPSIGVSAVGTRTRPFSAFPHPSHRLFFPFFSSSFLFSLSVSHLDRFGSTKRTEARCLPEHICCPANSMLFFWTKIRPSSLEIEVFLLFISVRRCGLCGRVMFSSGEYMVLVLAHRQMINQCNVTGLHVFACVKAFNLKYSDVTKFRHQAGAAQQGFTVTSLLIIYLFIYVLLLTQF